jgi:hypothetical protein
LLLDDQKLGLFHFPILIVLGNAGWHFRLGHPHSNNFDSRRPLLAACLKCLLETLVQLIEVINQNFLQGMAGAELVDFVTA